MEINEIFRRARPYSEEPNIIDGYRLAQEFRLMMAENGKQDIDLFLQEIDNEYENNLANKTPEEVLYI